MAFTRGLTNRLSLCLRPLLLLADFSPAKRQLVLISTLLLTCVQTKAGPILTEIHYNGPASGSDPDEFIELTNPGAQAVDLSGWHFTEGISYVFSTGAMLASTTSMRAEHRF